MFIFVKGIAIGFIKNVIHNLRFREDDEKVFIFIIFQFVQKKNLRQIALNDLVMTVYKRPPFSFYSAIYLFVRSFIYPTSICKPSRLVTTSVQLFERYKDHVILRVTTSQEVS